jgi:hypothetical protein
MLFCEEDISTSGRIKIALQAPIRRPRAEMRRKHN